MCLKHLNKSILYQYCSDSITVAGFGFKTVDTGMWLKTRSSPSGTKVKHYDALQKTLSLPQFLIHHLKHCIVTLILRSSDSDISSGQLTYNLLNLHFCLLSAFKPLEWFCVRLIVKLRKLSVIVYISATCKTITVNRDIINGGSKRAIQLPTC